MQISDDLFAGTINVDDPIEAVITRAPESIAAEDSEPGDAGGEEREPVQRFIDTLDQPLSIGVFLADRGVFVWWQVRDKPLAEATYTAITLLIVASPCALIIATPTATLARDRSRSSLGCAFQGWTLD